MSRFHLAVCLGAFAAAAANAGQIQIGGTNGLTSAYVGAVTGWGERGYAGTLFQGATVTSTGSNSLPALVSTGSGAGVHTMTGANGIVYSMINDGPSTVGAQNNNLWYSVTTGQQSITIPVNVFGVQNAYLMLNDGGGYAGENATIRFNFASGADTINLADLVNGTGAIRATLNCTSATGTINCPNPSAVSTGHAISSSDPISSNSNASGDATIVTSSVFKGTYSVAAGTAVTPFSNMTSGSSGNVSLDSLAFSFATNYSNTTLNSITIITDAANTAGVSRLGLSAITVSTTPEPTTIALFASGLGLLALSRRRLVK